MAGQLGARDLAGLAVGVGYYHLFLFIGFGLLMAVSPSVAHAFGAERRAQRDALRAPVVVARARARPSCWSPA